MSPSLSCRRQVNSTFLVFELVICNEWIDLICIISLEMATQNTSMHTQILHALSTAKPRQYLESMSNMELNWLVRRRLRIATLDCLTSLHDSTLQSVVLANNKHLSSINLHGCHSITDESLHTIAHVCYHLHTIDLSRCHITDNGIVALVKQCSLLSSININECYHITDISIYAIATYSTHLHHLCMNICNVSDDAVISLNNIDNLQSISLSGCSITDEAVEVIALSASSPFTLDITSNPITSIGMNAFIDCNVTFTSLNCSYCEEICDTTMSRVVQQSNTDLHTLILDGCFLINTLTIRGISLYCPNLINLSLSHCHLISENDLILYLLPKCLKLQELKVHGISTSNALLDHILHSKKVSSHLELLDITNCEGVLSVSTYYFENTSHQLIVLTSSA